MMKPKSGEKLRTVEKRCSLVAVDKEIVISAAKIEVECKLGLADSFDYGHREDLRGKVVAGDPDVKGLKDVIFIPGGK